MRKKYFIPVLLLAFMFLFCACNQTAEFKNTKINGQTLAGLDTVQATQRVKDILTEQQNKIDIKLVHGDKTFTLKGADFDTDIASLSNQTIQQAKPTFLQKLGSLAGRQNNITVPNSKIVGNLDQKIDQIASQIDCEPSGLDVIFSQNDEKPFQITEAVDGQIVNKSLLKQQILENLEKQSSFSLQIPTVPKVNQISAEELEQNLQKRSTFSTNYSSSVDGRKFNVQLALSAFNGLKVEPGQEISFNDVVEEKIDDNDFQTAKIILNGQFVNGKGGGVCQASTTLYNALLLADIEILEVHPHSLPVSYVPLAFDAMVNRGTSDMRFKNNLEKPFYIKTWGDETDAYVEIWEQPFPEGESVRRRAEFVGTIPHPGDKIVADTEGQYSDKITFKGEYYRAKMPQEGYESKAYMQYLKDGEVVSEKLIRHEYYQPQYGIIYEGTQEVYEGIELPENDVKFIPAQQQNNTNEQNLQNKLESNNPSEYNP